MKTRIVVDSAASLYALDGVDFACVPLKIITDDTEYIDDGTLDAVGMAQILRTYKGKTSTSCPNVSDWLAAYEGADEVYAITITGTLSGSCNAAQLAAEDYMQEHPGKRVFVLDSLSTGPEQQLLAEHLRDELEAGHDFDAVCEEMLRYKQTTHRGEHGALERIVLELKGHGYAGGKVHISHCGNPAAAERLKHMIEAVFDGAKVDVGVCGGLCSYYAELGGLLVGYEA